MEFEKFCRGPLTPVNSEYAWGTTSRAVNPYALSSGGQGEESISANYSVSAGNANYLSTSSTVNGPMRVGIFSANASNTGRIASGSSYWGIMELSGNLHERCVTLSNAAGRAFTGVHGDGMLDSSGYANVSQWPGTNATGIICRGGSWNDPEIMMRVSDRSLINNTDNWISLIGFRAVRGL
jgi:formylglycine-generating enzyme required for sulfatase activity